MRIVPMMSLLTAIVVAASGCASDPIGGPTDPAAASVGIRVEPDSIQSEPGGTATFRATVTGTAATNVTWSADCGSISQNGVFTAPESTGVCRVTAAAVGGSVGHALVSVGGWAASCAAEPEPTSNVVYVCDCVNKGLPGGADGDCVAGNDAAATNGKATPYQTWAKAQEAFRALPAGGTVALCKGGRWNVTETAGWSAFANANCATSACTVRDYAPVWGTGDEQAPRIVATDTAESVIVLANQAVGIRFLNLNIMREDHGATAGAKPTRAVFAYGFDQAVRNIEFCNDTFDGFGLGIYLATTSNCQDDIKVRGNRFLGNCTDAILASGSNIDVDGNYFDNNGHALCGSYDLANQSGGTTHTVYFNGEGCPLHNLKFRSNEVHRNAMYQGYSQGSPVKIRDGGDNVLVDNNLITYLPPHPTYVAGTVAITADNNGNLSNAGFDRMVISRNRVLGGPGGKIGVTSASNLVIENNLIWTIGQPLDHDIAINVGTTGSESRPTTATVRNNTLYFPGTATGIEFWSAINVGQTTSATGHVVTGNSITIAGGGGSCFYVKQPSSIAFMDNNSCSGAAGFATTNGYTNMSISTWRASAPSFDTNSITPSVTGQFVNPTQDLAADFTPALTPTPSPLIGAASAATCTVGGVAQPCSPTSAPGASWSPLDSGKTRDAAPDIGALEQ